MASNIKTVEAWLTSLPEDRRSAIGAVRDVIRKSLDSGYEEGIAYGMISYFVPHRRYPAGYHCDPKQPLHFAMLASQKNYMSLHPMCLYSPRRSGRTSRQTAGTVPGTVREGRQEARHGQGMYSLQEGRRPGAGCDCEGGRESSGGEVGSRRTGRFRRSVTRRRHSAHRDAKRRSKAELPCAIAVILLTQRCQWRLRRLCDFFGPRFGAPTCRRLSCH